MGDRSTKSFHVCTRWSSIRYRAHKYHFLYILSESVPTTQISEPAFALQFIALLEVVGYINNAHLSLCLKWFLSAVEYHKKGCQALIVLDALQWATVKGGNRNGNKS